MFSLVPCHFKALPTLQGNFIQQHLGAFGWEFPEQRKQAPGCVTTILLTALYTVIKH